MNPLRAGYYLARHLGARWILFRVRYGLLHRLGYFRRVTPILDSSAIPSPRLRLRKRPHGNEKFPWAKQALSEAEGILRGSFHLFSCRRVDLEFPPPWSANPLTGQRTPDGMHWSQLSDFAFGDIKEIWELNRFPWAFALARAYARSRDTRFAEGFWQLFEDWIRTNPPNQGVNWKCGQEATFRLIAVTFAIEAMADTLTPARQLLFSRFVAATGHRIAANLEYALSQSNNHGVSECVGLITAALLLEDHGPTSGWLKTGLAKLEHQLAALVYPDGSFAQHSLIYQRVLLHDLTWCRSRMATLEVECPAWLDEAGRRALHFLHMVVDPTTGLGPLFGANDGSNILPLADADYLDFRPVIQGASAVFNGELSVREGAWDETAFWLAQNTERLQRVAWPDPPERWHAEIGGYFQWVRGSSRLFLRCPTQFRQRPSQADMLHVDVVWRGGAVAQDAGSLSYHSPNLCAPALKRASSHNVLTIAGHEPMATFSRFLYLPWPRGGAGWVPERHAFIAWNDGFERMGVRWRRSIASPAPDQFSIRDEINCDRSQRLRWHLLLVDAPWRLAPDEKGVVANLASGVYHIGWQTNLSVRCVLHRADMERAVGWRSSYYTQLEPAVALVIEADAVGECAMTMIFSPASSLRN